jgi:hypothetical protein
MSERDDADFDPGQNPSQEPQFLQIVAEPRQARPEPKLTRVAFRVSRLMEFCSIKELQNQTPHSVNEWPRVVAKETTAHRAD